MSDVQLIVAALTAGMTAGVTSAASAAVQDAYAGLRDAVRRLLVRDSADGEDALAFLDSDAVAPADARQRLTTALTSAGAAEDKDMVAAAQRVLARTGEPRTATGKYVLDLREAQGTQVGDGNTQIVNFH